MSTPIRPVFRELLTLNLASLARLAFPLCQYEWDTLPLFN